MKDRRDLEFERLEAELFPKADDPMGEESAADISVNLRKQTKDLSPRARAEYVKAGEAMWAEIREMFRSRKNE